MFNKDRCAGKRKWSNSLLYVDADGSTCFGIDWANVEH